MALTQKTKLILTEALADNRAGDEIAAVLDVAVAALPQALAATDSPTFAALTLTGDATVGGDVKIAAAKGLKVNSVKVVGAQAALIAAPTLAFTANDPTIVPDGHTVIADGSTPTVAELQHFCVELWTKYNALLAVLKTHGLIASA